MTEIGTTHHRRRRLVAYALAALIAVFVVHGNTITNTFLADDNRILMMIEADGPFARWTGPPDVFLRPLVSLLFATDLWIYGLNPRGFHVTNLLLHAAIALWVLALGSVLARRAQVPHTVSRGLGLLAGGIFLAHPSHSESVAWIAGRSDLLAAVFALGSVVLYLRWREHGDRQDRTPRATSGLRLRFGSWLLLAAALASKEAAATVPGVLIALDLLGAPRRDATWPRFIWAAVRNAWWHWATIPVYLVIRAQVIQQTIGGYGTATHMKLDPVLLGQHFVAFLSRATVPRLGGEQIHDLVFVALVAAAAFAVWMRRRRGTSAVQLAGSATDNQTFLPMIVASIAAFGVAVVPALSMSISRTSSASERLVYLPSAFTAVASATLIFMLARTQRTRWIVGTLIVASLAVGSILGNVSWREAARASDLAVDAILSIDTDDRIYVLTIPGAIDGAHALHNNLIAALRMRRPPRYIKLIAPIRVSMPSIATPIKAIRKKAKRFIVASSDPRIRFQRKDHELYQISHRRRTGFRVDLPELKRGDWVIAWSNGGMIVVKKGSTRTPSSAG